MQLLQALCSMSFFLGILTIFSAIYHMVAPQAQEKPRPSKVIYAPDRFLPRDVEKRRAE